LECILPTNEKKRGLKQSVIFSSLNEEELSELVNLAVERSFMPGEYIFWDEDAPKWLCIVAQGRVKIIKHSSQGKDFIIAFFEEGEMFGEVAVFENKPYPASAQAVTETSVITIDKGDFLSFLAQHPEVALKIINLLGGRLRDAQGRLRDIAGERVEQRVAKTLLKLSSKLGHSLPFTRQEIADMAGTTPESTIRVMSRLRDQGVIRSARGKTIILDEAKLKQFSEG
jgi:CRP/FNR family transcriptional regulator